VRADFLKNHSNSIVVVKEPCSGGSDDESVLILDVYEISGLDRGNPTFAGKSFLQTIIWINHTADGNLRF